MSDNFRTYDRVDSVSNDMHLISELPSQYSYPDCLSSNDKSDISQMRNLKQELMLPQPFFIFHRGQTV